MQLQRGGSQCLVSEGKAIKSGGDGETRMQHHEVPPRQQTLRRRLRFPCLRRQVGERA